MEHYLAIMDRTHIALACIWIANIIYILGLLPQIRLNYKLKSVEGLSDYMIIGYMFGYTSQLIFIYMLHLPAPYKLLVPLGLFGTMIIAGQRLYYEDPRPIKRFLLLCGLVWGLTLIGVAASSLFPVEVGYAAGWISAVIWAVYQLPQGIKMFKERSVEGLSFTFISILAFGVFIELLGAVYLQLPLPQIVNNARGMIAYFIFCIEFLLFRKRR